MASKLKELITHRNQKGVEDFISLLPDSDNWSLVSIIDELLPLMLMQANLRFGNFHSAKMNLFLRRLAMEGFFSRKTEREIARVIALEMTEIDWVNIHAGSLGFSQSALLLPEEKILEEMNRGNVHNAFFYACRLFQKRPKEFMQLLLRLGANSIPESLGHSLSCFYPVVEDIISVNHPETPTALLTIIMFLSRFQAGREVLKKNFGRAEDMPDENEFLKLCASGVDIYTLHHTITFFIYKEWERAAFNGNEPLPYQILFDWVGKKEPDRKLEKKMAEISYPERLPKTFEEFSENFHLDKLNDSLPLLFKLLDKEPERGVDWVFRHFASHYNPDWDPHYYTGLYSAIRLYLSARFDKTACRMALYQAISYFAKDFV